MQRVNWKKILGSTGGRFLGAVLLVAAVAKAFEPEAFAEQIQLEGLDFLFSPSQVALIALAIETGLGAALLMGLRHWFVLSSSTLLVGFFIFLNGRNYWLVSQGLRDESAACGCFGSLIERTPAEAFWQDLFLLLPPLLLALWGRSFLQSLPRQGLRLSLSLIMALLIVFYAGAGPDLKFVDLAAEIADSGGQDRYERTREFELMINGTREAEAEIYRSSESVTFLVLSSQLSDTVLLRLRTNTVETIKQVEISRAPDGQVTISPDNTPQKQGVFKVGPDGIHFVVDGYELLLRGNPSS